MSASNSASDSKRTVFIFDLKVHILFIGYNVTIKRSSQKMDLEMLGFELGIFQLQTLCSTTELTLDFGKIQLGPLNWFYIGLVTFSQEQMLKSYKTGTG